LRGAARLEWRLGKDLVQVFADDSRLKNDVAIMNESGDDCLGIEVQVLRLELIPYQNIDVVTFPIDLFFREDKSNFRSAD
jgi:hypothetical protein